LKISKNYLLISNFLLKLKRFYFRLTNFHFFIPMQDELIDIIDKNGKPTGEIRLKSEVHKLGLYHASVHIWFYTLGGNILLQKRASDKDTYPDLWDISVAGHIGAGETPENAVIRETEEEIGLSITKADISFLKIFLAEKCPTLTIIDNEFHRSF